MLLSQEKINIKFFNYFLTSNFKVKYYYFDCFFFDYKPSKAIYLTSYWYFYKRFIFFSFSSLSNIYIRTFFNFLFIFTFYYNTNCLYLKFNKLMKLQDIISMYENKRFKWC